MARRRTKRRKKANRFRPWLTGAGIGAAIVLVVSTVVFVSMYVYTQKHYGADNSSPSSVEISSAASSALPSKQPVSSVAAPSATSSVASAAAASKPAEQTVTFTTSKGFAGITKNGLTYVDGVLIANKTYSLPSSYGTALTKETTSAFNLMKQAAAQDGIDIYISSGFRSYSTQKSLYASHVSRKGQERADLVSARAGHSEHQTGLAFDVNTIDSSFAGTKEALWLEDNCYKYGFILRYPEGKTDETGYAFEPWHFRYVGTELAQVLYNDGDWRTVEEYFGITSVYSKE